MDIILEDRLARVILTAPAPDIIAVGVVPRLLEDACADAPHDDAEDEEADREHRVISGCLFGSSVAAAPVADEDENGGDEGDAGDAEEGNGGPACCAFGPGRQVIAGWEVLGGVEDGECGGEHGEDDEGAGEVGEAESHFGHANADFDFLVVR